MCNSCNNISKHPYSYPKDSVPEDTTELQPYPYDIDLQEELDKLTHKLDQLQLMRENTSKMTDRDKGFAISLYDSYKTRGSLSDKQWYWVKTLSDRVVGLEPVYGDFKAILVMFRIAGANDKGKALKYPKVRLLTQEERYVQLNFKPDQPNKIDVYVDGWQGHGYRKFAGWIEDEKIIPYRDDRMTDDVKLTIQQLSLDPIGTAKAMAGLLGVCIYCGSRLTTPESKFVGYGPVCAKNWGLPWGETK